MLFFTRAFVCIGAIVVLAEGFGPADLIRTTREATGSLAPAAFEPVAALCRSKPETCMAIATSALHAAANDAEPASRPRLAGERRNAAKSIDLSSRQVAPR